MSATPDRFTPPTRVDLLVIGGGTAGLVAAKTAARFGSRVLLVERERLGGDCLWAGCVPSKSLIAAAHAATAHRQAGAFGVTAPTPAVDIAAVMEHVHGAIRAIEPTDSVDSVEETGARVLRGDVRFTSPTTAEIDGAPVRFAQAIIATGSSPAIPDLPGLDAVDPLTSDTVWELRTLPDRLVVLGGGAIGCELAQAWARLGSRVTLVHRGPRLLPKEDPDASAIVAAALVADGVEVVLDARSARVEPDTGGGADGVAAAGGAGRLVLDDGREHPFDRVLVATGRRPRTADLGLEAAGVRTDDRGYVVVDAALRTSNRRIRAAGDVAGLPAFTHLAGVGGSAAATNAVLGLRRGIAMNAVPRVTFTDPEVASVGAGLAEAREKGWEVREVALSHTDRAIAEGRTTGFARLIVDARGRVHGAAIVGPRAGETLGEASVAVTHGLTTSQLAAATHAYPTYSDALWNAAVLDVRARLERPVMVRAISILRVLRSLVVR